MYLGEEPRTTTPAARCRVILHGDHPTTQCVFPAGHTGSHSRGEGMTFTPLNDRPLVERLETGIAATVREIDELRAENTRLRAQLATCHCQDVA